MTKQDKTEEVCAAIKMGRVDLGAAQQAMRDYIATGGASLEWVLDLDKLGVEGLTGEVTAGQLPLGVCAYVMETTGRSWVDIHPIRDPRDALAILASLLAHRTDGDINETLKIVAKVETDQIEQAYSTREVRPADPT